MQWHTLGYMENPPGVDGPNGSCTPIDDDDGLDMATAGTRRSDMDLRDLGSLSAAGECTGWGGFDFNTSAYPDPQSFLDGYFHDPSSNPVKANVRVLLNTHPSRGIDHCQLKYKDFATFAGIDPASNETVTMDNGNLTLMTKFFTEYLGSEPLSSVDAWWTDYYGSMGPEDPRVGSQLLWSNYMYGTS